ncbi:hypothetical protein EYF80_039342 [Liparis tanakae]|uniref:Uncharacterized protein n=1 Tax=Liparis tanakae TaxID=230148 RepID=A0A4Z2GC16_9TELE|nr:hypothetical protein EYF80_039342 [Liparis tanakae]
MNASEKKEKQGGRHPTGANWQRSRLCTDLASERSMCAHEGRVKGAELRQRDRDRVNQTEEGGIEARGEERRKVGREKEDTEEYGIGFQQRDAGVGSWWSSEILPVRPDHPSFTWSSRTFPLLHSSSFVPHHEVPSLPETVVMRLKVREEATLRRQQEEKSHLEHRRTPLLLVQLVALQGANSTWIVRSNPAK